MGESLIEPAERRRIMAISEVAEHLGFHIATIRRWSDQGALPHFRTPGGQRRFYQDEVDAFLESLTSHR